MKTLLAEFTRIRAAGGVDPDWEHDRALHRTIAEASGNRRLVAEIGRYGEVVQTVREIVGSHTYGIHETTADEHLAILDALVREDPAETSAAMRRHLAQASHSAAAAVARMRSHSSRTSP